MKREEEEDDRGNRIPELWRAWRDYSVVGLLLLLCCVVHFRPSNDVRRSGRWGRKRREKNWRRTKERRRGDELGQTHQTMPRLDWPTQRFFFLVFSFLAACFVFFLLFLLSGFVCRPVEATYEIFRAPVQLECVRVNPLGSPPGAHPQRMSKTRPTGVVRPTISLHRLDGHPRRWRINWQNPFHVITLRQV